jgi:hypothetical protein
VVREPQFDSTASLLLKSGRKESQLSGIELRAARAKGVWAVSGALMQESSPRETRFVTTSVPDGAANAAVGHCHDPQK